MFILGTEKADAMESVRLGVLVISRLVNYFTTFLPFMMTRPLKPSFTF